MRSHLASIYGQFRHRTLGSYPPPGPYVPPPAPGGGYDIAARVAQFRAGLDSAFFLDASDPLAPNGIELPAAPVITSTANVSSIAAFRTNMVSGREVTLAPGTYTVTGEVLFTFANGLTDFRGIFTGCTLNITGNFHSFQTQDFCRRIELVGGTWNAVPQIAGQDIHFKDASWLGDDLQANPDANSTGLGVMGHRIAFNGVRANGWNGLNFVAPYNAAQFDASASGTTLTVNAMYNGTIHIGAFLVSFSGTSFGNYCIVEEQLTGVTGGAGTYRMNKSLTKAAAFCLAYERSTNILMGNCNFTVTDISVTPDIITTENPVRINSGHHIHTFDSRLWSESKFCARFHPEWIGHYRIGHASLVNCQIEDEGIQGVSGGGVYPHADHLLFRGNRIYGDSTMITGPINIPRYGQMNIAGGITGNGTTATATVNTDAYHGLATSDIVDILNSIGDNFNATGVSVTVLNETQYTFPSTVVGSASYASANTRKIAVTMCTMYNNECFTAPHFGVNGAGFPPSSDPNPLWLTCNSVATALSNGNVYRTFVSFPAWTKYNSTPTVHA